MSAALIDLVSVGAQDVYITGQPEVSFLDKITRGIPTLQSSQKGLTISVPSVVVMRLPFPSRPRVIS